jgi:hypothetical protein
MEAIREHFIRLAQEIENVPTALIFSPDDSGFQEFMDTREMCVIFLASCSHDLIEILANASAKRSMMLKAVSADGSYLN